MNKIRRMFGLSLVAAALLACAAAAHAAAPTLFDHYLCYKGALSKGETKFVKPFPTMFLFDQFEVRRYDIKDPIWHCNPVNKTYKGSTSAVNFPDIHLEGYPISLTMPPFSPPLPDVKPNITTVDQFGLLRLKVTKPESLNVRSSKKIIATGPTYTACGPTKPCVIPGTVCEPATGGFCVSGAFLAPPANNGSVDNFKCYKVAPNAYKFTKILNQVNLSDEFWTPFYTFDIVKPTRVCAPTDVEGRNPDSPGHPGDLVCYQILPKKVKKTDPPPPQDKYPGNKVADSNDIFSNNRLDVKTVNEPCLPATKAECGDGVVDAPYEECDAPKICSGGINPGDPCAKSSDCDGGGTCIPNKTQCPGGVACAANCTCPLPPPAIAVDDSNAFCKGAGNPLPCCTGSKTGTCDCPLYHEAGSFSDVCQSLLGLPCDPPRPVPSIPLDPSGTTFNLCTSAADANGMRALTVDPTTWFSDAFLLEPPATPFEMTLRKCPARPLTGVRFTKANTATAPPAKFCLAGDPAKLRTPCTLPANCDGPSPTTGNGVCASRDVDYTSVTTNTGTAFTFGDGVADPAGAALFAQDIRVDVWPGGDATCSGTGSDPTCVGCDGVTPAPAGRIGTQAAAGPPLYSLPFITRFTTGSAENIVNQAGNAIHGREVSGSGTPGLTASLVMVGGNAALNFDTGILADEHHQFFEKQVFAPMP